MTANDIFKRVRVLLDEWTDEGTIIPEADVVDLKEKVVLLIDMAQKELFKENRNYKTFEYSHSPVSNLLKRDFTMEEFLGEDQFYPNENGIIGAKSYYLEVDDNADIYIQENISGVWTNIETVNATPSSYTAYKGLLTVVDSNDRIRIKMSGATYYRHRNRALFIQPFPTDRIPSYKPYFKVDMPDDFREVEDIIKEEWDTSSKYTQFDNFKWEGLNDLYLNWYFDGNVRITYNAMPSEITSIDDIVDVDELTSQAIIYFVVGKIAPYENKELVNYAEGRYAELVRRLRVQQPEAEQSVENVYGDLSGNF